MYSHRLIHACCNIKPMRQIQIQINKVKFAHAHSYYTNVPWEAPIPFPPDLLVLASFLSAPVTQTWLWQCALSSPSRRPGIQLAALCSSRSAVFTLRPSSLQEAPSQWLNAVSGATIAGPSPSHTRFSVGHLCSGMSSLVKTFSGLHCSVELFLPNRLVFPLFFHKCLTCFVAWRLSHLLLLHLPFYPSEMFP